MLMGDEKGSTGSGLSKGPAEGIFAATRGGIGLRREVLRELTTDGGSESWEMSQPDEAGGITSTRLGH